jgi:hypothetical protein
VSRRNELLAHWDCLGESERDTLVRFAAFLRAGEDEQNAPVPIPEPQHEPRPESETVVGAIKRLSRVYAMLDRRRILNETSSLMGQHVMQGRDVVEVIDELERMFERHYRTLADPDG